MARSQTKILKEAIMVLIQNGVTTKTEIYRQMFKLFNDVPKEKIRQSASFLVKDLQKSLDVLQQHSKSPRKKTIIPTTHKQSQYKIGESSRWVNHLCRKCGKKIKRGDEIHTNASGRGHVKLYHQDCWNRLYQ